MDSVTVAVILLGPEEPLIEALQESASGPEVPWWIIYASALSLLVIALAGVARVGSSVFGWGVRESVERMAKTGDVVDREGHQEVLDGQDKLHKLIDERYEEEKTRLERIEALEEIIENGLKDRQDEFNDRLGRVETSVSTIMAAVTQMQTMLSQHLVWDETTERRTEGTT